MPRPPGRRNLDFADKRLALAKRARTAMLHHGPGASLREIAELSDTSLTNLRHYFGDRDGLYAAVMALVDEDSKPWLELTRRLEGDSARDVLRRYFELMIHGWRQFGVGRVFELGLGEGAASPRRGSATVEHALEPTLVSVEGLLAALVARGALPPLHLRTAALTLVAPVWLALVHQDALSGWQVRELDVPAFARAHVDGWLRGYGRAGRG